MSNTKDIRTIQGKSNIKMFIRSHIVVIYDVDTAIDESKSFHFGDNFIEN